MKRSVNAAFPLFVLFLLCSRTSFGQDLVGDWQGTLAGARALRLVVHVERTADAALTATLASLDQSSDWGQTIPVDSFTVAGDTVKLAVAALRAEFDGTISPDASSIIGTWTQGGRQSPFALARATADTAWKDPASHSVRFVTVEPGVRLEVLDWGGPAGARPLVLVPGLGNTAHVFDALAPKLAPRYRVLGVTRRGFGASSAPASGYGADRLGDDLLAVMQQMGISRPVLVGHSFGGEELSSIGSRHPESVAGLVYLEAGYSYAFYAPGIDPIPAPPPPEASIPPVIRAITDGMQRYTRLPVPILAVFAIPQDPSATADAARRAATDAENRKAEAQVQAFAAALPQARVVRIPHANHYVFTSNEADVIRELDAFIGQLQSQATDRDTRPHFVRLASGEEVSGQLLQSGRDEVRLLVNGRERTIAMDHVVRVERSGDPLKNGAIIGAVIAGAWCALVCGQGLDSPGQIPLAVAANAGVGALIGAGFDAAHRGRTLVYPRSSPAGRTRAPQASVSWRFSF